MTTTGLARAVWVSFAAVLTCMPAWAQTMTIDRGNCKQPDRSSAEYKKDQRSQNEDYVKSSKAAYPNSHIAVALNRYYGQVVQLRRDHVALNDIPAGPKRNATDCALTEANYRKLILIRDASYYIFCRAEVAVGQSAADRAGKTPQALAYAAIYDLLKTAGVDMRAKPTEPTTPLGGFAACTLGASDGFKDPIPTAQEVKEFTSRLTVPDSEKQKIGEPENQ